MEKIRKFIKKMMPKSYLNFAKNLMTMDRLDIIEKNIKTLFQLSYRNEMGSLDQKIDLANHEFKIYSKVGEDGLILYILSKIGAVDHSFMEMGVEEGRECNTANLALNFGWRGLLIDASKQGIEKAKIYYQEKLGKNSANVKPLHCFITAENINQLLSDNGMQGEIDLMSMDIDGNDYWIWKALNVIKPRLVVAEYNASYGPSRSLTIKYNSNHFHNNNRSSLYFGASLTALKKLADSKGYILVGCDSQGHDAFFVRRDLAAGKFKEVSPEEAFYPLQHLLKTVGSVEKQFETINNSEFENI
ncbi:MAG: hypothetical protein Q7R84_00170 [bacterium]|nr:hypothetical protein [bacterium]